MDWTVDVICILEFHQASRAGDLEEVKQLIIENEGFDPLQTGGENGRSALHYAAIGGQLQFVKEARQKTAEKVTQMTGAIAEDVSKTDVGQAIQKVRRSFMHP